MAFDVGGVRVDPPVLLAPMEDVSNEAFRAIVKRIARPGLMFTEFVSAMAIHFGAKKTLRKMRVRDDERPLGIQIFGGDEEVMAETARLCEELGADIVDINMGCWVPKVCKTGSGAALLKDPEAAEKIVQAVVRAVSIPVTVKVRAGWTYDLFAAPELARRFEGAGAKMLTLHARFARQGFEGTADWTLIAELRRAISIPLVGNGDIKTGGDALRMMRETGCDGVMVGRSAISNPWALRAIVQEVRGEKVDAPPRLSERISVALEHLRLAIRFEQETGKYDSPELAENAAVRSLRAQTPMYIKGEPGAAALRNSLVQASSYAEVAEMLRAFERHLSVPDNMGGAHRTHNAL
ncbi:MAG TPA: tRNA dihydrouridine synthase DusB [Fimbriimonadales bacterium]|nr:tRNA dihydrouridine synthase DusB [Fimbriimonadales bacterium]